MKKQLTLAIVYKDKKILLGLKKRGFGVGRWNGFGGKVESSESIEDAAIRELQEESGIIAKEIQKIGILDFEFENLPDTLEVHVFRVNDFDNEAIETEEMTPEWFDIDKIPFELMWSDDIYWMPYFLENKKFVGKFLFDRASDDKYQAKILSFDLRTVE